MHDSPPTTGYQGTRAEHRWAMGSPTMRRLLAGLAGLAMAAPLTMNGATAATPETSTTAPVGDSRSADPAVAPPRTIVTTDPELDDLNSMLRMLLYANEIDLVGLVYSSSQHHYSGDPATGVEAKRWPEPDSRFHIDLALDAYKQAYPNLVVHDPSYPSPEHLRSLVAWGNVKDVGDMAEDTAGSDLIKQVLLDDEPGQVFLQAWGGPNTIARALKSIEDEYRGTPEWEAVYRKVVEKTVITSWGQQDATFTEYVKPTWPEIENREVATSIWGYGSRSVVAPDAAEYHSAAWTEENVSSVGPFGAEYRVWGDGKQMAAGFDDEDYFGVSGLTAQELQALGYLVWTPPQERGSWISEGDSSNFALLVDNGLRNWEDPSWGGWGGRQVLAGADPVSWTNRGAVEIGPDGEPRRDWAAARWFGDVQRDFAARLQWSVTPTYAGANHEPEVEVPHNLDLVRTAGSDLTLDATTSDPDGDDVSLRWWQYQEAGTYDGGVELAEHEGDGARLVVPEDAQPGQTLHLVATATDDGEPALTSYARVVVTVAAPDLDRLRSTLEQYVASEDVGGPASRRLGVDLDSAGRLADRDELVAAAARLERFLQHLDSPSMRGRVSDEAREVLAGEARALISEWG